MCVWTNLWQIQMTFNTFISTNILFQQFCTFFSYNLRWEKDRKKFWECCCFFFILLLLFQIQLSSVRLSSIELRLFNSHKHAHTSNPFHSSISFNISSECGLFSIELDNFWCVCRVLCVCFILWLFYPVQASCRNFISVFSHYLSLSLSQAKKNIMQSDNRVYVRYVL